MTYTADQVRALTPYRRTIESQGSLAELRDLFGVTLASSRDSLAYSATGLGYGVTNASLVVRRGLAAETVSVSRTGRVRR